MTQNKIKMKKLEEQLKQLSDLDRLRLGYELRDDFKQADETYDFVNRQICKNHFNHRYYEAFKEMLVTYRMAKARLMTYNKFMEGKTR